MIGAEVNIGARLQQAAAPGEILAGETTHQLTAGSVEYGPVRSIEAKGFDDGDRGVAGDRADRRRWRGSRSRS